MSCRWSEKISDLILSDLTMDVDNLPWRVKD